MTRKLFGAIVCLLMTSAFTHAEVAKPGLQTGERIDKQITVEVKANYLLFLPQDYGKEPAKKWPVIVFLHGSGERGQDLRLVKAHGVAKIVEKQKDFPFVVISPQCPREQWWQPATIIALLDEVLAKYKTDPDRVYLTGLSMGGFGTWQTAIEYPNRFAAIAPICGGGNPYQLDRIQHLPIWVFHGEKDKAVPIAMSVQMVGVLQQLKADVRFTRYPEAGHDAWTETYDNKALYDWFLEHKRGRRRAPPAASGPVR